VKRGLPMLQEACASILEFVEYFISVLNDGRFLAVSANDVISSIQSSSIRDFSDLGDYCATSDSQFMNQLTSEFNKIISSIDTLDGFLEQYKADNVKENIVSIQRKASQVENIIETYMIHKWVPKMYSIVVCLTIMFIFVLMSVFLLKNQFKGSQAMLSFFLMPFFGIIITIGWVVMIFSGVAATMNSDFCYGDGENGPVWTVENSLIEYGLDSTHILSKSFQYYKSSCTVDNPWRAYTRPSDDLLLNTVNDVGSFLTISSECGPSISLVTKEVTKVRQNLAIVSTLLDQVLQYTDCDRMMPLYNQLFNGSLCSSSLNGLSWVFYSLLTISFFGLLMISFRGATNKVENVSSFMVYEAGMKEYETSCDDFNRKGKELDDVESAYSVEISDVDETVVQKKTSDDTRMTAPSYDSNDFHLEAEPLSPLTLDSR
jgi:hypothetical protein